MEEFNININDDILHDIQLVDTKITSLHCNIKEGNIEDVNVQTNISVSAKGKVLSERIGESIIQIKIISPVFELNAVQSGRFEKKDNIDISKEVFESFLAAQGIRLLWSFARENIYEITCKMLRKPIMLPTLDVMKALKKK